MTMRNTSKVAILARATGIIKVASRHFDISQRIVSTINNGTKPVWLLNGGAVTALPTSLSMSTRYGHT